MNVYDFDNTILRGDSSYRFFAYCLTHFPRMWRDLPGQVGNGLLYLLKLRPKQAAKQRMFHYLTLIGDVDDAVAAFWKKNQRRVKAWYLAQRRDDDVVISASPEFLVRPACERAGIRCVIGSPVDKRSGVFLGNNCHDVEKVSRFYARFPGGKIENFYSDSRSDAPMAAIADHAWLVKGDRLLPWK